MDQESAAFYKTLSPEAPDFYTRASRVLTADENKASGALKDKLLLLTHLVERDLAHDGEPVCVYLLMATYKEHPTMMELIAPACAYEAAKYPDKYDWAAGILAQLKTRLEVLKQDPAEAERRWASCAKTWPQRRDEEARARRLFELMASKAGPMPPPPPPKPERHVSYGAPEPD